MARIKRNFDLTEIHALLPSKYGERTLRKARWYLAGKIADEGARCPCCRKWAKVNAFNLTGTLLRKLILLTDKTTGKHMWVETADKKQFPAWFTQTNDHSKLAYWGLLESRGTPGAVTKQSGHWRPTKQGLRFARNKLSVPATAFVYDSTVVGHSVELVLAADVKTKGYNYWEEMRLTWMAEKMKFPV